MDWQLLIVDLRKYGVSQSRIAEICKCGQATISDLANKPNREPAHALGQALIALHKREQRKAAKAAA